MQELVVHNSAIFPACSKNNMQESVVYNSANFPACSYLPIHDKRQIKQTPSMLIIKGQTQVQGKRIKSQTPETIWESIVNIK